MITKDFFKIDSDFFVYHLKEEDILRTYEKLTKKHVTIKYRDDKFVLYVDNAPEWESDNVNGIFEHVVKFINGNSRSFTIKIGLEDAFDYIYYNCTDTDMKLSSYEYLIECSIQNERKYCKFL